MPPVKLGRPPIFRHPFTCRCGYYSTNIPFNYRRHAQACNQAAPIETFRVEQDEKDEKEKKDEKDEHEQNNMQMLLRQQLTEKDRVQAEKDVQIERLERENAWLREQVSNLVLQQKHEKEQLVRENKAVKRRKDKYQEDTATRKHRPEHEKREIAERQQWLCNNPFNNCCLPGLKLRTYEVDHIIPPNQGGTDDKTNLQALCPNCHSLKTALDRAAQVNKRRQEAASSSTDPL